MSETTSDTKCAYVVVDHRGDPYLASESFGEVADLIDEHEMIRVMPEGRQRYLEKHDLADAGYIKVSPERFDIVRVPNLGRRPVSVDPRRQAWKAGKGWLTTDGLRPKTFNDLRRSPKEGM